MNVDHGFFVSENWVIYLMKFWQEKLPNFIYDINYEKLTENKEDQVKKLLNFCNLNWEENC